MGNDFTEKLMSLWPFGKVTFNWDDVKIGNTPIEEFEGLEIIQEISVDWEFPSGIMRIKKPHPLNRYRWPGKARNI